MIEFTRRARKSREPDMTPLVDIVFKLVLFFMLTSSFIASQAMELNLPAATDTPPPASKQEPIRLQIAATGHVLMDGKGVDREALESALSDRIRIDPEVKIGIFTTPGVSVQQLVSVMDMVYSHGGHNVQVDRLEYPTGAAS